MKHIILLLSLFAFCLAGCGGGVRVSGTVTYEEDGSPVKKGIVVFTNDKLNFGAGLRDGHYVTDKEGVMPGTYTVWLNGVDTHEVNAAGGVKRIPMIDPTFSKMATSPFKLDVKSGGAMTFDLVVKKPSKKVVDKAAKDNARAEKEAAREAKREK